MFVVVDIYKNKVLLDKWGHFKVYANAKAARRVANNFNNSVSPPIKRMDVRNVGGFFFTKGG